MVALTAEAARSGAMSRERTRLKVHMQSTVTCDLGVFPDRLRVFAGHDAVDAALRHNSAFPEAL